ncbi:hypothetical protein F5050DRAFT_1576427, partial [Lentinula boryana]
FGIKKRRFKILNYAPEYSFTVQSKLVPALGAIHNFIHQVDPNDLAWNIRSTVTERQISAEVDEGLQIGNEEDGELGSTVTTAERRHANARRDTIAEQMWNDYLAYTSSMESI